MNQSKKILMNPTAGFKMNTTLLVLLAGLQVMSVGCGLQKNSNEEAPDIQVRHSDQIYADGRPIGTFEKIDYSMSEILSEKRKVRATALVPIAVDPKFKTSLFRMNYGIGNDTSIYIAPRLYVFGSRGLTSVKKNKNGTVTIPFHIALIDGKSATLEDPTGSGAEVLVPESLRINQAQDLENYVKANYGPQTKLSALAGCPAKLVVYLHDKEIDVTPPIFKESDFCQINKPFSVSLTIPESDVPYLVQAGFGNGALTLHARFDVMAPISTGMISLDFDRTQFQELIQARLSGSYKAWAKSDVTLAIQKILTSSNLNVQIMGEYSEQMKSVVDRALTEFFEPFVPSQSSPAPQECKGAMVCLQAKMSRSFESRTFSFQWNQTSMDRIGQRITSHATLKPLNQTVSHFGQNAATGRSQAEPLKNNRVAYDIGLTAQLGDTVEFMPTLYTQEDRYSQSELLVSRQGNVECVNRKSAIGGSICVEKQEFFNEVFQFERPQALVHSIPNPIGGKAQLLENVIVAFRFQNQKTLQCPILAFSGDTYQGRRRFVLADSTQCPIVETSGNKSITGISLIYTEDETREVTVGSRSTYKNVQRSNSYNKGKYKPVATISGEVKVSSLGLSGQQDKVEIGSR